MDHDTTVQPSTAPAFTSEQLKALEAKILIARRQFIQEQSWFGNLIGKLKLKLSNDIKEIPTCATDGTSIFFGANFVSKVSVSELVFTFGHELLHCLLNHHLRRTGSRKPLLWNCACDYVVNAMLVDAGIGKKPKGVLYDKKFADKTCEEIYAILEQYSQEAQATLQTLDDHGFMKDSAEGQAQSSQDISGNQQQQPSSGMSDEVAEQWTDTLTDLERDLSQKSAADKGSLEKSLEKLLKAEAPDFNSYQSQISWKEELREFIKCKFLTDLTYMRPNRKTQSMGIVLPSMRTEEKLNIAIALDTSGSMESEWITNFLGEIQEILLCYEMGSIHLWCFDTKVHSYKVLDFTEVGQLSFYKPKGGGGTDFTVNWKLLEKEHITPDLLLMLTDGYPGSSWGEEHVVDACFAIAGDSKRSVVAPFGKTIYID